MTFDVQNTQQYHNAKPFELIAQRIIMHAYNVQVIEDDDTPGRTNHAEYDFRTSDQITYEVKRDSRSIETGNFYIKFSQRFKEQANWIEAGLYVTKADYYMITFGNNFYKIQTDIIIELLIADTYPIVRSPTKRGDFTRGFLLPVKLVKPFAEVYSISGFE